MYPTHGRIPPRPQRKSLSLDEELVAEAPEIVGTLAVSRLRQSCAQPSVQHDRLSGLLADLVQEHGPIDPEVMEEVRQEWQAPEKKTDTRRIA